jgi:DNA-directed RNA polymerase specialized sigma24 family protein
LAIAALGVSWPRVQIREAWAAVVAEIRRARDPHASPALGRLYDLALKDGLAALASFHGLDTDARGDLVRDVLAAKLREIVAPTTGEPRALFLVAVRRRAIDGTRRARVRADGATTLADMDAQRREMSDAEGDLLLAIDVRRLLATVSRGDHDLLAAVFSGEDRDEVAQRFGTSRANVDQKVSRFRRRLRWEEP